MKSMWVKSLAEVEPVFSSFMVMVVPKTVALSTLKLVLDRATDRSIAAVEARSMTSLDTRMVCPVIMITVNNRPRINMAAMLLSITSYTVQFRGEASDSRGIHHSILARAAWSPWL
jgi:hypothetical protein